MIEEIISGLTKYNITENQATTLSNYVELLLDANKKFNLTRIVSIDDVIKNHLLDSMLPYVNNIIPKCKNLLDIGTGAGFPGVPLAVADDELKVTMLDSSAKKLNFVKTSCETLGISNTKFLNVRVEDIAKDPQYIEKFDIVVARAVAPINILLEIAAQLVKVGGYFAFYKGEKALQEVDEAKSAAGKLHISYINTTNTGIDDSNHNIVLYQKKSSTPSMYPRLYAKIKKQPL